MWIHREKIRGQFNIIIVPSNGGATTTFNLSGDILRWGMGLLVMILFFLATSTCFFYSKYTYVSRQLVMSQKISVPSVIPRASAVSVGEVEKKVENTKETLQTQGIVNVDETGQTQEVVNIDETAKIQEERRPAKKQVLVSTGTSQVVAEVKRNPDEESVDYTLARKIRLREEKLKQEQLYIPDFKPCEGVITSYFGERNNPLDQGSRETHKGIDVANALGTPIYAAAKGTVTQASYLNGYGYVIYIDHGNGVETRYAHNDNLYVEEGDEVEKGEKIADMGSTGNSTGPHLHFEIRKNEAPVNPNHLFSKGE